MDSINANYKIWVIIINIYFKFSNFFKFRLQFYFYFKTDNVMIIFYLFTYEIANTYNTADFYK